MQTSAFSGFYNSYSLLLNSYKNPARQPGFIQGTDQESGLSFNQYRVDDR